MLRFFQLLIIIYIIIVVYNVLDLQKYNKHGYVYHTNNTNEVINIIQQLTPILYHDEFVNDIFDEIIQQNKDYKLYNGTEEILLEDYSKKSSIYIFQNKKIIQDLQLQKGFNYSVNSLPQSRLLFVPDVSLSIFKGKQSIPLQTCKHNYNMLEIIQGESTVYLFNPKHKEDILHKENNQIKKWAHKIKLVPQMTLFIPPNWFYIQEIDQETIQYHINIDTLFTCIPNYLKNL